MLLLLARQSQNTINLLRVNSTVERLRWLLIPAVTMIYPQTARPVRLVRSRWKR